MNEEDPHPHAWCQCDPNCEMCVICGGAPGDHGAQAEAAEWAAENERYIDHYTDAPSASNPLTPGEALRLQEDPEQ